MTLAEIIRADDTLLNWARTSIRYNDHRAQQVANFIDKLTWNRHPLAITVTKPQITAALVQIEREDRDA